MAYPTTTELSAYLTAVGLTPVPAAPILQTALNEAIEEIERISGRTFIPATTPTTDFYDGIFNVGKELYVEVMDCHAVTEVKYRGTVLVLGTDYRLKSRKPNQPTECIEFLRSIPRGPDKIEVTSTLGWANTPAGIFAAVLKLAAVKIPRSAAQSSSSQSVGPVKRRKIGNREEEYAVLTSGTGTSNNGFSANNGAETEAKNAATAYQRLPWC